MTNNLVFSVPDVSGDDACPKRTGTLWTASAHIITSVMGVGVLSLAWAIAQLGWIAGPLTMLLFAVLTFYTSTMLTTCYRSGDSVTGTRNSTYMDAVTANLGGFRVSLCGLVQFVTLFGVTVSYTTASSIRMADIERSICFHKNGVENPCPLNSNRYMIAFGIVEIILSQILAADQLGWMSIVAVVMAFCDSGIELGLGFAKIAETGEIKGSLTGVSIGSVTSTQKLWGCFQALGVIAFSYGCSLVLLQIQMLQDTIRSPPSESKTMKKASLVSIAGVTLVYTFHGCIGFAVSGDMAPRSLLNQFGFYNPYWLVDIAHATMAIHLVGTFQVYCQTLFTFVEKAAVKKLPNNQFITREIRIPILGLGHYKLNLFRLVWMTVFVIATTVVSMLLPLFIDIVGLIGALGFWPLTVYFPVEMYIKHEKIPKWSTEWVSLQILSVVCLIISVAAAAGSVAGVVLDLKSYKPFGSES